MIEFEVINPHDSCTMQAPDFVTALAAIGLIGEGRYGLLSDQYKAPPALFGDWPSEVYASAGLKDATDLFDVDRGRLQTDPAFNEAVAVACESLELKSQRSSTIDLVGTGKLVAQALRRQRSFRSIDARSDTP